MDIRVAVITEVVKAKVKKHEMVGHDAAHAHKEIIATDVPVESGMDGKGDIKKEAPKKPVVAKPTTEVPTADEGDDEEELKHLPEKHDQRSHGGARTNEFLINPKSKIPYEKQAARLVEDAMRLVNNDKKHYSETRLPKVLSSIQKLQSKLKAGKYKGAKGFRATAFESDLFMSMTSFDEYTADLSYAGRLPERGLKRHEWG